MKELGEYVARVKELNPTIIIRQAEREDGVLFVTLFNSYYARNTNLAYFHWQFFDSPFVSRLFVAFDGEKLVGYYGIKILPLTQGLPTGFAVDFLTEESYRKRGIAFLLEDAVFRFGKSHGVGTLSAFPNAYGNAAFKVLGWKSVEKIDTLMMGNLNTSFAGPLVDNTEARPLIGFNKDGIYRKWRFDENPLHKYETIKGDESEFAVTKLFKDPISGLVYGDIVDLEFHGSPHNQKLLFSRIINYMQGKKVKAITTWALSHTREWLAFTRTGFKPISQERYFCLKVIDPHCDDLVKIDRWRLVQADAEIY